MAGVERYGIEPVPAAERTVGWRDLFAINFTFFLNPVMMVLGALAVLESGLPLPWAVVATIVGQLLAYLALTIAAQPGVDDGLPGQVAMRAPFGELGARGLTSPYRVIASTYWFAAQALAAAFGIQAIAVALADVRPPLVPTALAIAVVQAGVAVLGFDVMRWLLRIVLPLSIAAAGVMLAIWLASDDPRYAVERVLDSPEQELTWVGFATVVTVMCGSSLTLVTNIADLCRYTRSRRDMRIGLVSSTLLATATTTFLGAVFAVGRGRDESLRRRERAHLERARPRRAARRGRRPDVRGEPDERLHGRPLARDELPGARSPPGDRRGRARRGRPLGVPLAHRGGAVVDHPSREPRRADHGRRARGLPRPATRAPRRAALYARPAGDGFWDGSTSSPSWRSRPGRSRTPWYRTRS